MAIRFQVSQERLGSVHVSGGGTSRSAGDPPDDAQLLAAVAAGNMPALAELVCRHQANVLSLAYRMLSRWDLAEDVAQEAFLRVLRAAGQFEPKARFTTWLYRIVVNLCLDVRRRMRQAPISLPETVASAKPEDPVEIEERASLVRSAVAELPERQRLVLVLHRYQDLSHRQIADVTGWSESAVESLLVRAYAGVRRAVLKREQP